jgi:hypothetical protein
MGRSISNLRKDDVTADRKRQAWWGIAGLFLVVAFIAMALVLSEPAAASTYRFVAGAVATDIWRIFVGAAIFVGLLSISGIIFSLFIPRKKDLFTERELDKERKFIRAQAFAKKERAKEMRRQISKARRDGK